VGVTEDGVEEVGFGGGASGEATGDVEDGVLLEGVDPSDGVPAGFSGATGAGAGSVGEAEGAGSVGVPCFRATFFLKPLPLDRKPLEAFLAALDATSFWLPALALLDIPAAIGTAQTKLINNNNRFIFSFPLGKRLYFTDVLMGYIWTTKKFTKERPNTFSQSHLKLEQAFRALYTTLTTWLGCDCAEEGLSTLLRSGKSRSPPTGMNQLTT
jgi:hypothetical protein